MRCAPVRPALDAYYNSLSDEQKARLTLAQPHMRGTGMGRLARAACTLARAHARRRRAARNGGEESEAVRR
jgi:hypothetical protein